MTLLGSTYGSALEALTRLRGSRLMVVMRSVALRHEERNLGDSSGPESQPRLCHERCPVESSLGWRARRQPSASTRPARGGTLRR